MHRLAPPASVLLRSTVFESTRLPPGHCRLVAGGGAKIRRWQSERHSRRVLRLLALLVLESHLLLRVLLLFPELLRLERRNAAVTATL